jgi:hypothetical protein
MLGVGVFDGVGVSVGVGEGPAVWVSVGDGVIVGNIGVGVAVAMPVGGTPVAVRDGVSVGGAGVYVAVAAGAVSTRCTLSRYVRMTAFPVRAVIFT